MCIVYSILVLLLNSVNSEDRPRAYDKPRSNRSWGEDHASKLSAYRDVMKQQAELAQYEGNRQIVHMICFSERII